jgi:hypothetical protein
VKKQEESIVLYYLGKGTQFEKEECKEYKTIEGALKAAAKDESLVVWDENGQLICPLTDNVLEGALQENHDGSVNVYDVDGNLSGTVDATTVAAVTENDDGQQDKQEVITPQGTMRVTVVCDGTLNIRRSATWGNENICGRATRGQSYYVKAIHTVDGKKMVQTIDDLYLSGQSEHVQFEQL